MRLSRPAAATAIAAAAAATLLTALPAQALRPSTTDLADSSGSENGCSVTVTLTEAILASSPDLGPGIFANTVVTCPESAGIHRLGFSQSFVEVLADGSYRPIGQGRTGGMSQAGPPISVPTSSGQFTPCSNRDNDGAHTYFVRARVSAKQRQTFRDPNPYIGKVAALATLTC